MVQYLKLLKLNSFINITTSISWNIQSNEIHIFCDSGRIVRPIFNLIKKDKNNDKYNSLINGDYSLIETWKKGSMVIYIKNMVTILILNKINTFGTI